MTKARVSVTLWWTVPLNWCLFWHFYFATGNELAPFLSAYFIFFTNLAFPNFYKITCTNIDLPVNFLEISGSGENLADSFK